MVRLSIKRRGLKRHICEGLRNQVDFKSLLLSNDTGYTTNFIANVANANSELYYRESSEQTPNIVIWLSCHPNALLLVAWKAGAEFEYKSKASDSPCSCSYL